jgi:hypothetical protein
MAGGKSLDNEDAIRGAVARFGVSESAEAVNAGLTKSVDVTNRAQLGSNIAARLDTFKAAADTFAPPTMLVDLAIPVDSPTLSANARRVYAAATPLAHLLLSELQALLDQRSTDLAGQRRFTILAAGGIGVLGILTIWLLAVGRRRVGRPDGSGDVSGAHARLENLPLGSLTYARELLDAEELVHSGRTARSTDTTRSSDTTRSTNTAAPTAPPVWGDGDAR